VDFSPKTDVGRLLSDYRAAMAKLAAAHPKTTIWHMTAPLEVNLGGARVWLKDLIGRSDWYKSSNIVRNQYNDAMRAEFSGKAPLFDLASAESTLPDGSRAQFSWGGKTYSSLAAAYAKDEGHLNASGRQWVAAHFLRFLAGLAPSPA